MANAKDNRDVLQVLQTEQLFLRVGGYDRPPASRPAGPTLIFQDSPACPNAGNTYHAVACAECSLAQFIPAGKLNEPVPCRHIPLNDMGETVETLYRWGTLAETKMILADWLRRTIDEIRFLRNRKPQGLEAGPKYRVPDGA